MNKDQDNPDTFVMDDEQTEWESTHVDDVFLPSVQVLIRWSDVEVAVERGAILPSEAHGLWAGWAAPGSPLRRIGVAVDQAYRPTQIDDTGPDDLPDEVPDAAPGGAMKQVVMLLIGVVVGAALMFALGR